MLGLIAGRGRLPFDIAQAARRRGLGVAAVAFHGDTDPALAEAVDRITWLHLGELEALLSALHEAGARDVVMAGKILKTNLYGDVARLKPDARAIALIAGLRDRSDDGILGAIADTLAEEGLVLRPQAELVPELLAGAGRSRAGGAGCGAARRCRIRLAASRRPSARWTWDRRSWSGRAP